MYKKGRKLDSKGIILACVGIIIVCIAINVAFALFPPTGRTDDNAAVESSAAPDGVVGADGYGTDDESKAVPRTIRVNRRRSTPRLLPSPITCPRE